MFCSIENSIWAPQQGFEDWSIYYLQRRGFSKEDVAAFVKGFNSLVRRKFVGGAARTNDDIVVELRGIARKAQRHLAPPVMA
jgi:hypothetical protein